MNVSTTLVTSTITEINPLRWPSIKWNWLRRLRGLDEAHTDVPGYIGLHDGDNVFDPFGVLCDVIDPAGWQMIPDFRWVWHGHAFVLPVLFFETLGIPWEVVVEIETQHYGYRAAWPALADMIEKNTSWDPPGYVETEETDE